MSSIQKYVEERIAMLEIEKIPKPVKFSVSIENETNFRLQYLAKELETSRANLAADFIQLAIVEAEKTLGINPFDFDSEYGKAYIKNCGGNFHQDETGYYRVNSNGEKVKITDPTNEEEVDYSSKSK
ncbi:hypothetical protein D0469_09155 [Peribacillus saganii]|uniref:Uncharacterized protein n=1 Tax=Peribacillus saganii TaxID=2303992 RepID=A0A372LPZ0_9BACI|nr:hypothetical protein [Peribacillus saganii]RFU69523.1 hypothetical protein D0469_09155 [Peribacillus saganii]